MDLDVDPLDPDYIPTYEAPDNPNSDLFDEYDDEPLINIKKEKKIPKSGFETIVAPLTPIPNVDIAKEKRVKVKKKKKKDSNKKIPKSGFETIVEPLAPIPDVDEAKEKRVKVKKKKKKDSDKVTRLNRKDKKKKEILTEKPKDHQKKSKRRPKLQLQMSKEVEAITNSIPFYGCAVCADTKFNKLEDLYDHVMVHKDRMTSWDLKQRNQKMRKTLKKAQKKLLEIKEEIKEEPIDPEYDQNDPSIDLASLNCATINSETANITNETALGDMNFGATLNGAYENLAPNLAHSENLAQSINLIQGQNMAHNLSRPMNCDNLTHNMSHNLHRPMNCENMAHGEENLAQSLRPNCENLAQNGGDICNDLANQIGNIMMGSLNSNIDNIAKELDTIIGANEIDKNVCQLNAMPIENRGGICETRGGVSETMVGVSETRGGLNETTGGVNETCVENGDNTQNVKNNKDEAYLDNLERIFKCGGCGKQFSLGYYLKLHVRSHTGEKPYICQECGQTFITASKLSRHRKRTHLSIRVECRICRRKYTRLEFLIRHFNRQHADDKIEGEPYDYNAILPYLKELEEELAKKKEEEEKLKQEEARRFPEELVGATNNVDLKPKSEGEKTDSVHQMEVKVKVESDVKEEDMKSEGFLSVMEGDFDNDGGGGDFGNSPRMEDENDRNSNDAFADTAGNDPSDDEDYFPDNTWLPIKEESPKPTKKPKKTSTKKPIRYKEDQSLTTCHICNKTVSSSTYLRIHMRTHTKEKPFKCHLCQKAFITGGKLNRHLMTHGEWEEETEVKQENPEENEGENSTEKPKKGKKKRRKCPIPNRAKPEYINGERVNRRKKPRPHACEFCKKRFLYIEALQVHRRCHAGEALDLHCGFCLEPCPDLEMLKEHESRHTGPRPYLCNLCGRNYTKKETMIYHRRMHDAYNKFQCDICPKSFNAKNKLQRHLLSHRTGKCTVKYECPVCAHCFNTRYHIEMHLGTHEKEGVIQEENRGQVLAMVMQNARRIPLDNQLEADTKQLEWGDERSRICNICGEIFMHFYLLEQHLKSHGSSLCRKEEERKHICPVCNKGFKLNYYLKLHSFTHTKEKPFICQQCGKGFITRGKLKRHLETHAGVKKYQCHICCKFFTRPSYLRIHVRTIHGTQDYNFKINSYYSESVDDLSMASSV